MSSIHATQKAPGFLRMKGEEGKNGGSYPHHYREMIHYVFGKEENTIEVCSGSVRGRNASLCPSSP